MIVAVSKSCSPGNSDIRSECSERRAQSGQTPWASWRQRNGDGDGTPASNNHVNQAVRALETPGAVSVGGSSAAKTGTESKPSLFSRLGRKLKALVTKPPRTRH
jgi:hypothetical protein